MEKAELLGKFQRLGKVLMTPVLILPVAGILVGLGNAFTSSSLLKIAPWLGLPAVSIFFAICKVAGNIVMGNIPIIFAICVAYGFAKSEKATAALCGFLGYMTMNAVMGTFLTKIGTIDPKNLVTGQASILGIITLDTGVIGGLAVGLLVAYLHNRFYKIELPPVLSIFNGTRFIPAITLFSCSIMGLLMSVVFPPIQSALTAMSEFIRSTGVLGGFVYGAGERLLLPFGLHHFVYLPFMFTSLGGSQTIDGNVVTGAVNLYNAILNTPGMPFDIEVSRFVMNGKVIFAIFGLPGAALAFYKTSLPKNKKKIAALMVAILIPCVFMGITEPVEYAFLFVAPVLYAVHAVFAGLAYALTYLLNFNVAGSTAFGGPFLSFIFNGILGADKGSNWQVILVLGPLYFLSYFFIFKTLIKKFDLKTPGRSVEEDDSSAATISENSKSQEKQGASFTQSDEIAARIPEIIEAVGGAGNIKDVDVCFTRLRIALTDTAKVDEDEVFTKALGAHGIVHVSGGVQVIYGNKASLYATQMREVLGLE